MAREHGHETVVRSSCWTCGTVDLGVPDITVLITLGQPEPRYSFTCPGCQNVITKPTTGEAVRLLEEAGARVLTGPFEAARPRTETPLTEDDLIAFGRALADASDLAGMAARVA